MSRRGVVYGFILIFLLIQVGGSRNPDDRITGLEEKVNVLESQVVYLTGLNQELLKHVRKVMVIDNSEIDTLQKTPKLQTESKNEVKKTIIDPTLEERVEKVEQLTKVGTLRSCEEYAAFGIRASGMYPIDPDGILVGQPPFNVFCRFDENTGQVSTEVIHSYSEGLIKIDNCEDPGCYIKNVTYISGDNEKIIEKSQLAALIDLSSECEQSFYYECTLAPLRDEDVDYAFWVGRDGKKNVYFTGSDPTMHACDCHYSEEGCLDEELLKNTCNCDSNEPTPLVDTGLITSPALPILTIAFGGLRYDIQQASYTIGRLICKGNNQNEVATSCKSLKLSGETKSGYYTIKDEMSLYASTVFCDMSHGGYENVPEVNQLTLLPLGTILPWVNRPSLDSQYSIQEIPEGWQR